MNKNFSNLKVILMEPNGSLNVGNVTDYGKFEINELVISKCDIHSLEARKMALKGKEYLEKC